MFEWDILSPLKNWDWFPGEADSREGVFTTLPDLSLGTFPQRVLTTIVPYGTITAGAVTEPKKLGNELTAGAIGLGGLGIILLLSAIED